METKQMVHKQKLQQDTFTYLMVFLRRRQPSEDSYYLLKRKKTHQATAKQWTETSLK